MAILPGETDPTYHPPSPGLREVTRGHERHGRRESRPDRVCTASFLTLMTGTVFSGCSILRDLLFLPSNSRNLSLFGRPLALFCPGTTGSLLTPVSAFEFPASMTSLVFSFSREKAGFKRSIVIVSVFPFFQTVKNLADFSMTLYGPVYGRTSGGRTASVRMKTASVFDKDGGT